MSPSKAAQFKNYMKSQKDAKTKILDDRPEKDDLIAPISHLFQPFGYFHDIRRGVEVPGEAAIHEGVLWRKVDALADRMVMFHEFEEERCSKFIEHLEDIFNLSPGTINSSKIPGGKSISDGHLNGKHGAIIFCVECKNEASAVSCEPNVQLALYIAASFRSRVDHHPELFNRWRVPALIMTHVGKFALHFSSVLL